MSGMVSRLAACSLLLASLVAPAPARAVPVLIEFDELLRRPAGEIDFVGVHFEQYLASLGYLAFDGTAPGSALSEPVLEATPDTPLILEFATPTPTLSFALATRGYDEPMQATVTVQLFDAAGSALDTVAVLLSGPEDVAEGLFAYDGAAVARAVVEIDRSVDPNGLFLDDLTFETAAARILRDVGADGSVGASGQPGGAGGAASQVVSAGLPLQAGVATGGAGGDAGPQGDPGGRGGDADADVTSVGTGADAVEADATARGGDGGAGRFFGGDGGAASATAHATSEAGPALARAQALGGLPGSGDAGGRAGTATAGAEAHATQGGDATAIAVAQGGRGANGVDGTAGADAVLIDAVDGSTSGRLTLFQEAVGGPGGLGRRTFNTRGAGGAGGDATSRLTREVDAATATVTVRALGGRSGGHEDRDSAAPGGGRAEAIADVGNAGGSVELLVRAEGGDADRATGGPAAGAGGEAVVQARATTTGDGQDIVIGDPDRIDPFFVPVIAGAIGGSGGRGGYPGVASGRGGDATSQSTGIALGNGSVTVVDSARGGDGGSPASLADGGGGGDASSTAHGSNAGNATVRVYAGAHGGSGGGGDGAGFVTGDGGDAAAHATGISTGGGAVDVRAFADAGRSGQTVSGPSGAPEEDGGNGGVASGSAHGESTGGDVHAAVLLESGASDAIDGGGRAGHGGDVVAIDAATGSTSGTLTLVQDVRAGGGGQSGDPGGQGGDGGSARSEIAASNPGGGDLFVESFARGGYGGSGGDPSLHGAAGGATSVASATSAGHAEVASTATAGTARGAARLAEASASAAATGASGAILARADARRDDGLRLVAQAAAPVAGTASGAAAVVDPSAVLAAKGQGDTAFVVAGAFPRAVDLAAVLQSQPRIATALAGRAVALAVLGFAPGASADTLTASLDLFLSDEPGPALGLGFFDPVVQGGFDGLRVTVVASSTLVLDRTFDGVDEAMAYLEDRVVALGLGMAGLDLSIRWTLTGVDAGSLFEVGMLLAVPEAHRGLGVLAIALALGAFGARRPGGARRRARRCPSTP